MRNGGTVRAAWTIRRASRITWQRLAAASLALSVMAFAGCTPGSYLLVGADPADPAVPVAPVGYRSTVAPYTHLRPAAPKGWQEQNQQVAPAPKRAQ